MASGLWRPTTTLTGGAAPKQKVLAVAKSDGGPFVPYTLETIQARTYPMFDRIYAYVNVDAKTGVDPKVKEFLRFIVSRQGQELIQTDGKYLPLTAAASKEDNAKLDKEK